MQWLKGRLEASYEIKTSVLGPDRGECSEVRILNRVARWTSEGIEFEADPRHAEIIISQLGLRDAKGVSTPGVRTAQGEDKTDERKAEEQEEDEGNQEDKKKRKAEERRRRWKDKRREEEDRKERPEGKSAEGVKDSSQAKDPAGLKDRGKTEDAEMSPEDATLFRSVVARANFLALDRPDLMFSVKEASRSMACPRHSDWQRIKRIGRYLIAFPRVVQKFPFNADEGKLTIRSWSDSDWAGCLNTRKSTSGGAIDRRTCS